MDKSSQSVLSNLIWRFMERCGSQLISFVVSVVLARLLAPELYGSIALVTVITSILQVFVDSGMANALIQKRTPTTWIIPRCFTLTWCSAWFCI